MLATILFNPVTKAAALIVGGMVLSWFVLRNNPKLLRIDLAAAAAAIKNAALDKASGTAAKKP